MFFLLPLPIVIIDCFLPESAPLIIEVAEEYDEQVCGLVLQFAALKAKEELNPN